ncbi:MAG: SpoIIE family protein phosphatase [Acidobacteriaceae bacterium]|nr:SpoIIE family protein phosphatase [Acidobacteriaceae bacterium]
MWSAAQITRRLGKLGIAFLISLALYIIFDVTGHGVLLLLDSCVLVPLGVVVLFRATRSMRERALWSVRNRLLVVYGLFGVLPVLLLFAMFALAAWTLMSELAIYLATSALERRIDSVDDAVLALKDMPPDQRPRAAVHIRRAYSAAFPGIAFYFDDATGSHRYPPSAAEMTVPRQWKDVRGLLVYHGRFYAWAHYIDQTTAITALAPLTDNMVANLVPHLGVIALVNRADPSKADPDISVGALNLNADSNKIPAAVSRLDLPVALPSTQPHVHLDQPGTTHNSVLWVRSRISAVLRAFFSGSDSVRGVAAFMLIVIASLFLVVEIGALVVGIGLSRRITRAVSQIYEGTRRVIYGDFKQRIPVAGDDQLGELAASFNQMTGNLERLVVVEKERQRLQTEIEIAREVQSQLYPREAPPSRGLKLTARCEPARMVSGDYYDYQALANKKLAFAIGDVAGKGISAALLMATIQAALRAQITEAQPITDTECTTKPEINAAALVSKLNKQVHAHTAPEKYATFFFAVYDQDAKTLTYTNAGHLSPLLFRNGSVARLDSNGMVVGAFSFARYDESCVTFEPGDLLVCYTDGITEPENAYGEMFGEERLTEIVQKHVHSEDHEIIRILFDAVRSWTGSPELQDDMTLLLARQVGSA